MWRFARVLVAATSMLAALTTALLDPTSASAATTVPPGTMQTDTAYVRHLVFEVPLRDFSHASLLRTGPGGLSGDTRFDWSTDLCSAPLIGDTGRTFDFTEPCRRHDFGYRNTKLLDQRYGGATWNRFLRKRLDQRFLADMVAHCRSRSIIDRPSCLSWAYAYYGAVRVAGGP